jgi:tetratricopeptide (TPR) repeat protein
MKKLRWALIISFGVLAACGSLWVSHERPKPPESASELTAPTLRPAPPPPQSSPIISSDSGSSLDEVERLYTEGRRQLYNAGGDPQYLHARELLRRARALLDQLTEIPQTQRLLWEARLEFELGTWYQGMSWEDVTQAHEALPYYLAAEQLARRLTELAPELAEGYRLLGESQMRIISLKGWLHALAHALEAKNNLERALELDPRNAEAHLALGVYYLYAPMLFGGSAEKALSELQQSEALTSDQTVLFLSYRWQGVTYVKLGKVAQAREAFEKALAIYPKSTWDRNELEKVR